MLSHKHILHLALLPLLLCLPISCTDDNAETTEEETIPVAITEQAMTNYSAIVLASYEDSLATAKTLDTSIDAFIAAPDQAKLDAAKEAWLESREPYLQTEVYRFYDGPIDNEADGPEGLLNAWPLDEKYIDYVEDDQDAGIVNDTTKTIDADTLLALNEQGGEKNIATGYHAIEFLLWGQDQNTDGPGDRPYTDYVEGENATAPNADRRKLYLATTSDLLVVHLESLVDAWQADQDNYRKAFLDAPVQDSLARALSGMIVLSGFETGGERLQTALDSGDQEDEHSCFSDNTHRDMIQDIQGIQNVYLGSYTREDGSRIEGKGIKDVIAARDTTLAADLDAKIQQSLDLAKALQTPFDQEIAPGNTEGRARVTALITSLREQEELLQDAFRLFDLEIPEVE